LYPKKQIAVFVDRLMVKGYVAIPKDDSLESYLVEALYLLETRFKIFDTDGAGFVRLYWRLWASRMWYEWVRRTIQFDELIRGLSMEGFTKGEELKACFELVDVDQSGGLEFSEVRAGWVPFGPVQADSGYALWQFFALIFTWCRENPGGMNIFFSDPANQNVVEQSMSCLLEAMGVYDTDRSFRLSKTELYSMFCDQMPTHVESGLLDRTIQEVFPKQVSPRTSCLHQREPERDSHGFEPAQHRARARSSVTERERSLRRGRGQLSPPSEGASAARPASRPVVRTPAPVPPGRAARA
jgi:hypothetical protein